MSEMLDILNDEHRVMFLQDEILLLENRLNDGYFPQGVTKAGLQKTINILSLRIEEIEKEMGIRK